jgi:hypothetical protein
MKRKVAIAGGLVLVTLLIGAADNHVTSKMQYHYDYRK